MNLKKNRSLFAASLAEISVASGVFLVIGAAFFTGVVALQKNFKNTVDYAGSHSAQLRISDYIARDLRQALSVSQSGSGQNLVMTLTIPNYYTAAGVPRMPTISADGSVSYRDNSVSPAKTTAAVRYYILNGRIYRELDGAATPIAENVQNFVVIPLDSTRDPNATTDFNFSGITSKVAELKVQVNFTSKYGRNSVAQVFYNTTLMRNARTDAQTNLY